jgi:DNA-binding response OmpR family regulator
MTRIYHLFETVIFLSSRAGEESLAEGFSSGADDYLTKPFTARQLLCRIDAHIRIRKIRVTAAKREQVLRN